MSRCAALVVVLAATAPGTAHAIDITPPDGRVYERVSAQDTGNQNQTQSGARGVVLDDDRLVMGTGPAPTEDGPRGVTDTYLFSRSASAWSLGALTPRTGEPDRQYALANATNDLSYAYYINAAAEIFVPSPPRAEGPRLVRRNPDGTFTVIKQDPGVYSDTGSGETNLSGISADGEIAYYSASIPPDGFPSTDGLKRVYRWTAQGGTTLVAGGAGDPTAGCQVEHAGGTAFPTAARSQANNNVSADGQTVFLQASGTAPGCTAAGQVYAVRDGQTLPVSFPTDSSIAFDNNSSSAFVGATPDGSTAYFSTNARLVQGDQARGQLTYDLYRWTAPAGGQPAEVSCLSCETATTDRNILGTQVRVSRDGQTVYFTSRISAAGLGTPDATNLFVFRDGAVRLVQAGASGSTTPIIPAQPDGISRDGTRITFPLTSRLNGSQILSVSTALVPESGPIQVSCLACASDGTPREGASTTSLRLADNAGTRGASSIAGTGGGLISDDDDTVLFYSRVDLETGAALATPVEYRWTPSTGSAPVFNLGGDGQAALSPSGNTIFGFSYDRLTADTTQDARTLYAARIGGGFPAAPAAAPPCTGDACQGPAAAVGAAPTPASTGPAGGNVPARKPKKAKVEPVALRRSQRAALARGERVRLAVRVTGSGTVRARSTARIGRRTRTVASGSARATGSSSTVRITLSLSEAALDELEDDGRLVLTTRVRLSGAKTAELTTTLTGKRG